jgi:hypothetical protein
MGLHLVDYSCACWGDKAVCTCGAVLRGMQCVAAGSQQH